MRHTHADTHSSHHDAFWRDRNDDNGPRMGATGWQAATSSNMGMGLASQQHGQGMGGGGTAADMPWQLAQDSMASSAPVPVCHYLGEGRKRRPAGLSAAGGNMQGIDRGIVRGSPGASRASGKKMDGGGAQQASQEAGVRGVLLPVLCAVAGPGPSPSRVYQRMTPRRAGAGTPAAVRRRRPSTPG